MQENKDELRRQVKELLRRVPSKVNSGSVQDAIEFKAFYERAQRAITNPRSTEADLTSIHNQAIAYYL